MTTRVDATQLAAPKIPGPTPGSPDWHFMEADLTLEDVREQYRQGLSQPGPLEKLLLALVHAVLAQAPAQNEVAVAPAEREIDSSSIEGQIIAEQQSTLNEIRALVQQGDFDGVIALARNIGSGDG
jgi:hypothetical protein